MNRYRKGMDRLQADEAMKERLLHNLSASAGKKRSPLPALAAAIVFGCIAFFFVQIFPLVQQELHPASSASSQPLPSSSSSSPFSSVSSEEARDPLPPENPNSLLILGVFPGETEGATQYAAWNASGNLFTSFKENLPYFSYDQMLFFFATSYEQEQLSLVFPESASQTLITETQQLIQSMFSPGFSLFSFREGELLSLSPEASMDSEQTRMQCQILLSGYAPHGLSLFFGEPLAQETFSFPFSSPGEVLLSFGQPEENGLLSTGTVYQVENGTQALAPKDGTVLYRNGRGTQLILSHGNGQYSLFYSLESVTLQEGDRVSQGEPVGSCGESPAGFAVLEGNAFRDPESYFS